MAVITNYHKVSSLNNIYCLSVWRRGVQISIVRTVVVQLLSCFWLFVTPWTAARQASLSITDSHVHRVSDAIQLSHPLWPLLFLPLIFPSIKVFSSGSALCNQVAKVLELQLQHQGFQLAFRVKYCQNGLNQSGGRATLPPVSLGETVLDSSSCWWVP